MYKPYSLKTVRLSTSQFAVKKFDTVEELNRFKTRHLELLKADSRSQGETFQIVSKYHKDAAFDYEILESQTVTIIN